jgi:hypothetical protein
MGLNLPERKKNTKKKTIVKGRLKRKATFDLERSSLLRKQGGKKERKKERRSEGRSKADHASSNRCRFQSCSHEKCNNTPRLAIKIFN